MTLARPLCPRCRGQMYYDVYTISNEGGLDPAGDMWTCRHCGAGSFVHPRTVAEMPAGPEGRRRHDARTGNSPAYG